MRASVLCGRLLTRHLSLKLLKPRIQTYGFLEVFLRASATSCSGQPGSKDVSLSFASFESTQAEDHKPPIIILHGLFGSKNNWKSLSKAMVNATERKVYTLDARNHGESPHTDDMDYILMANDVDLFCKERNLQKIALIGHSMGGRTAMTFALTRPSMVERLVVVDVSPVTMPSIVTTDNILVSHINAMDTVLPQLSPDMSSPAARKEADRILTSDIPEASVRQFLLANLQKGERLYEWQFNLKALKQNLPKIIQMHDLKGLSYDGNTLFICGGNSPYVSCIQIGKMMAVIYDHFHQQHLHPYITRECTSNVDLHLQHTVKVRVGCVWPGERCVCHRPSKRDHGAIREQFPKAEIVYVKGAGHWVHAEKPAEFLDLVKTFLADSAS